MNLKRIISSLAVYLPMAMVSQAAMTTTLNWEFNTSANPSSPSDSASTTNPSGGVATAAITSSTSPPKYYFNAIPTSPPGGYGAERGLWDTVDGRYTLTLGAGIVNPGATLNYTLKVNQFVGNPDFLSGLLSFSLGTPASHTQQVIDSAPANGDWVQDTFTWVVSPGEGWLSLAITPDKGLNGDGPGELILDSFQWTIVGDIAIPEPGSMAIAALGMLALGMRIWSRRAV